MSLLSQTRIVDRKVWISGQVGEIDPTSSRVIGTLEEQLTIAFNNAVGELENATSAADIVAVVVYLRDATDEKYAEMNQAYAQALASHGIATNPPTRTVVGVSWLPLGALVELTVTAARSVHE